MKKHAQWALALTSAMVATVAAGCGNSLPPTAGYAQTYSTPPATATAAESSYGAPAAEMHRNRDVSPAPARPGLGTEWGETRSSHVQEVSFSRQDASFPAGAVALRYNDREGIDAFARARSTGVSFASHEVPVAAGITVSVRSSSGRPYDVLMAGGQRYVAGRAGDSYTIRVQNHTGRRYEIVATVDGLDVISGRPGSLEQRGYIVAPHSYVEIDGFRRSDSAVASFRFGRVADSYAAQTGSARNVGVLGIAAFPELSTYSEGELRARETANPFPAYDPRYAKPPQ